MNKNIDELLARIRALEDELEDQYCQTREEWAQKKLENDQHYLRKIVSLGEKFPVITQRPLTTEKGIKLVDSGVHISERLYDKLTCHKLLPAIDECLAVDSAVKPQSLAAGIEALLADGNFGKLLVPAAEHDRIVDVFARFPLDPVVAFKLTVAREQTPDIFRQSLQVALCAVVLAMHGASADERLLVDAAAAGLFHDLGFLHINSELFVDGHRLTQAERSHVYSHPLLGHLILSGFPEWHPRVSRAVLEHHERMDGSGYPRGLTAGDISPLGQLLALAELVPALFSRQRCIPLAKYVHMTLRLNHGKFDRNPADAATHLIARQQGCDVNWQAADVSYTEILSDLVALSIDVQGWHALAPRYAQLPLVELIDRRIKRLERNCAGVGLDLQH